MSKTLIKNGLIGSKSEVPTRQWMIMSNSFILDPIKSALPKLIKCWCIQYGKG